MERPAHIHQPNDLESIIREKCTFPNAMVFDMSSTCISPAHRLGMARRLVRLHPGSPRRQRHRRCATLFRSPRQLCLDNCRVISTTSFPRSVSGPITCHPSRAYSGAAVQVYSHRVGTPAAVANASTCRTSAFA